MVDACCPRRSVPCIGSLIKPLYKRIPLPKLLGWDDVVMSIIITDYTASLSCHTNLSIKAAAFLDGRRVRNPVPLANS